MEASVYLSDLERDLNPWNLRDGVIEPLQSGIRSRVRRRATESHEGEEELCAAVRPETGPTSVDNRRVNLDPLVKERKAAFVRGRVADEESGSDRPCGVGLVGHGGQNAKAWTTASP